MGSPAPARLLSNAERRTTKRTRTMACGPQALTAGRTSSATQAVAPYEGDTVPPVALSVASVPAHLSPPRAATAAPRLAAEVAPAPLPLPAVAPVPVHPEHPAARPRLRLVTAADAS